ncbi:MAG: hypothetical protein ACRD2G_05780, partial [Terriglobia bacterium]
ALRRCAIQHRPDGLRSPHRHRRPWLFVRTLGDGRKVARLFVFRSNTRLWAEVLSFVSAAPRSDKLVEAREQRIAFLETKLKKKDEVLAELMEEHVALKKSLGEI